MKKRKRKRVAAAVQGGLQKVRIGYLSADFGAGRTRDLLPMYFFSYDAQRFEIYAYHTGRNGDTDVFAKEVPLREIGGMTPEEAAAAIRADGIDLLVDLSLRVPDTTIRSIMELRPAPHIVSLAEDCPAALAEHLPTVEGKRILARSYTPFERVHRYTYRAPLLDASVPAIGVAGTLTEGTVTLLVDLLCDVLQALPSVRLVLPAAVTAGLTEEDLARIADAGTAAATLELVDELPYETLDLAVGVDVDLVDVCRAAEHAVPLLAAEVFVHGYDAVLVLEKLGLSPVQDAALLGVQICRLAADRARLSELHGSLHWQLSDLFDVKAILFSVERAYDRLLARGCTETPELLAERLARASAQEKWADVIAAAHALDGMERLDPEQRMSLAWAYFFCDEQSPIGRWALLAEGVPRAREAARLYLSVVSMEPPGTQMEIFARAQHGLALIDAGLPAVPTVRSMLLKTCADRGDFVIGSEATSTYACRYAEEAESGVMRRGYYGVSLFRLNAVDIPAAEVYRRSCGYADLFADVQPYIHRGRRRKEKIRIGYISGDFRQHVMQYFIWPFLAGFDRDSFEVYVYNLGKEDQYSAFFRTLVTAWRDLRPLQSDMERIAQAVHADEVDILFDLAGHTNGSGLDALAWKPAPVQLSGLGYMATTGLPAVDYFVTDHFCDPEGSGSEAVYVEKLLRLTSQFCYNGYTNLPASEGTPAKTRGYVLFASFNQYVKLQDMTLLAWREIMERVPNSRLLLKNSAFAKGGIALMAYARLQRLGFDMSRVMFEEATRDYMERYLDVDIALDTYPWPGGGTTCDALYMGVPVISYYTERHSTRFTYSLLANIGLAELASVRMEDYVEKAVALAGDLDLLDALHRGMRERMKASPVMDQERYIREMEDCYRAIWEAWEKTDAESV